MNDEYIRRVEAEEAIEEYCCRRCKEYSEVEGGCVSHAQHCEHLSGEEILKPVKSADVQPVKRGEWKYYKNTGIFDIHKCSVCNTPFELPMDIVPSSVFCFCPHCGAKMELNSVTRDRCSNYMDCDGNCFIDDTPCDCAGNIEKCKGR